MLWEYRERERAPRGGTARRGFLVVMNYKQVGSDLEKEEMQGHSRQVESKRSWK